MNNFGEQEIINAEKEKISAAEKLIKVKEFLIVHKDELERIHNGTDAVKQWLMSARLDTEYVSLDLGYSGDKHTLQGIWHALRTLGYKSDTTPKADDSYFSSTWNHSTNKLRIFLKFSSTVCKRVKVGTKMVEEAVYETRCE